MSHRKASMSTSADNAVPVDGVPRKAAKATTRDAGRLCRLDTKAEAVVLTQLPSEYNTRER